MADTPSTLRGLTPPELEVRYGDSLLVPSPFISVEQEIERDENNDRVKVTNTRTLTGNILVSGLGFHKVYTKQLALFDAFSEDGLELTIKAGAGNSSLASGTFICSGVFPRVVSIEVPEDVQFQRLEYTVVLEEDVFASGVASGVENITDTWSFEENDTDCTVSITHSVSVQGLNTATGGAPSNAIENAIEEVKSRTGLANKPPELPCFTQPVSGSDVGFFEVTTSRSESLEVEGATYSIDEEFTLVSGTQPFVDQRTSSYNLDSNRVATVTLAGTIRGLGRTNDGQADGLGRSGGGTGFERALSGFNNVIRPLIAGDALEIYDRYTGSGILAVNNPQATSVTQNPCQGSIGYSFTFTDDPVADLPSGIVELTSSVQRNDPVLFTAFHAIPFRAIGSLIQQICSTQDGQYSVAVSARAEDTGDRVVNTNRAIEVAETELNRLAPDAADFVTLSLTNRDQTVDDTTRSIRLTYQWTFTQDISVVPDPTTPVSLERVS